MMALYITGGSWLQCSMNTSAAMQTAIAAARQAGAIILAGMDQVLTISDKGASNNLVTQIDQDCERTIVDRLRRDSLDSDFLGEEGQYADSGSRWLWVIDPLDGTTNFIKGIRWFSVSIGLWDRQEAKPVLGVVYNPTSGELFRAMAGAGAWLDEPDGRTRRLAVSQATEWRQCLFTTGFYYDRDAAMQRTLDQAGAFMRLGVMDIRRLGSAALDLANVAAGRLDGFWEHVLSPWDFMAGILLVTEAGGRVSSYAGQNPGLDKTSMVAANPVIQSKMLAFLADRRWA